MSANILLVKQLAEEDNIYVRTYVYCDRRMARAASATTMYLCISIRNYAEDTYIDMCS